MYLNEITDVMVWSVYEKDHTLDTYSKNTEFHVTDDIQNIRQTMFNEQYYT